MKSSRIRSNKIIEITPCACFVAKPQIDLVDVRPQWLQRPLFCRFEHERHLAASTLALSTSLHQLPSGCRMKQYIVPTSVGVETRMNTQDVSVGLSRSSSSPLT